MTTGTECTHGSGGARPGGSRRSCVRSTGIRGCCVRHGHLRLRSARWSGHGPQRDSAPPSRLPWAPLCGCATATSARTVLCCWPGRLANTPWTCQPETRWSRTKVPLRWLNLHAARSKATKRATLGSAPQTTAFIPVPSMLSKSLDSGAGAGAGGGLGHTCEERPPSRTAAEKTATSVGLAHVSSPTWDSAAPRDAAQAATCKASCAWPAAPPGWLRRSGGRPGGRLPLALKGAACWSSPQRSAAGLMASCLPRGGGGRRAF